MWRFFGTFMALVIGWDTAWAVPALLPFQSRPYPVSITLSPSTVTNLPDNLPVGTLVATATVTMSDNTTNYAGQLLVSDSQFVARGLKIVTAVAPLTPDGPRNVAVTAN